METAVNQPVVLSDPETRKKELGIELGEVNFQHLKRGIFYMEKACKESPDSSLGRRVPRDGSDSETGQKLVQEAAETWSNYLN